MTRKMLEDAAKCPQNGLCTKCEMDCVRTLHNGYFDGCVSEAAQTALAYRAMLERLEWHNRHSQGESYCPVCFYHKSHGHANDCELAALLKESEVEGG